MVYKPTRSQQFGVRPVGVSPATGLRDMATAIGKVAQTSEAIRQHDRKMRFDQAVLDAELAGKTAVKFDENNKVIPITSMEYNPDMFYGADEAQVQSVFKKALTQTYKTAFANDVTSAAENAALNNPANPEGVKAIMEEYGMQVENLPDELKAEIMPTYLSAFGRSERFVRSQLMDKVKKESIASNQLRMNNIFNEKINHYLMAHQVGETVDGPHMDRLDRELGEISQALETLGIGKDTIAEVMAKGNTMVASAAAEGHLIRLYEANGGDPVLTSLEIDKIVTGLSGRNQNLDLKSIESNLRSRFAQMQSIDSKVKAEESARKKENYDFFVNDIHNGDITTDQEIDALEGIDQSHRNALKSKLLGKLTNDKNLELAEWNRTVKSPFLIETNMLLNEAGDTTSQNSVRRMKFQEVGRKIREGLALGIDVSSIHGRYLTELQNFVIPLGKMEIDEKMAELKYQMSAIAGYYIHPSSLMSDEFIDSHTKAGLFKTPYDQEGKAKSVYASVTVAEWKDMVLNYADRYDQFHQDASKYDIISRQLKQGIGWDIHGFDKDILSYMREKTNFGTLSIVDPKGGANIRWEDAMLMTDRPDIQLLAIKKLTGLATTHGLIPEDFALTLQAMDGMLPGADKEKQELIFGTMQRAVAQIHESFEAKHPGQGEDMTRSLLKFNGVNYSSYVLARDMGFENWTNWNAKKNTTQAVSRELSSAVPEGYNDSMELFDAKFKNIFQNWGMVKKVADAITPWKRYDPVHTSIRNSIKQIGTSDLDFVWNSPLVKKQIFDMTFSKLAEWKVGVTDKSLGEAIVDSMSDFGSRIGIQEVVLPDGREVAQVIVNPIHKEALKTIVPMAHMEEYADFALLFSDGPMKYIKQDFMHQWYSITRMGDPDFSPNAENLFFVPNTIAGQTNTWTVMEYKDGLNEPIIHMHDYSYDFQKSIHSLAMVNAYEATKGATGLSKFFLHNGLFNTREMKKIMERSVDKKLSPYETTGAMVKFYNNFMSSMGSSDLIDMREIRENDASQFLEVIKGIERNTLPGLFEPWQELQDAYKNIPPEIRQLFSYGQQNQKWDDVRQSIWK